MALRWVKVLTVGICAVGLLGACGDDTPPPLGEPPPAALTHDQYQKALWEIRGGQDASRATQLYFNVVGDLNKEDCAGKTHALHDHLDAIVRHVEGLRPPPEAEHAQRAFLEAAQESVRLVGVAADDVESGKLTCGEPMNSRIYGMASTKRAEQAIEELAKLDYNVLGN